ncbi:lymphocyte function-associated antigen 3 [Elephas maximus indicus]|uniref:lymphocyte function-associated antigen 3 n=1 Tax=Elephas maximus indicus TaxID=99487 RepID=UPI002116C0E7|nr:lymphocyte function-associated antigen 3 [Elephas maximus indicus]
MAGGSDPGWALRVFSVFLLLGLVLDFIGCDPVKPFGIMNGNVTLNPSYDTVFKEITWKKQKDKVVEWYRGSGLREFPPYQGRIFLNVTSGELTIFNLTSSDEDLYELESQDLKDSITFLLSVLEPLPSPILNCTLTDEKVIVWCLIPEHYNRHVDLIKYSWDCPLEQCKNSSNPELEFKKDNDLSKEIQCTLSNQVSKMKSSIVLRTCVPDDRSRHRWLVIIAIVTSIVILLLMLFRKSILRNRRKAHEIKQGPH